MANPFTEAYDRDLPKLGRVLAERFINSGGTREMWIASFDEVTAARMPGESHTIAAQPGLPSCADARQPNASGEGQRTFAQQGQEYRADPARSPTVEEGHDGVVHQDPDVNADLRHPDANEEANSEPEELRFPIPGPAPTAEDWKRRIDDSVEATIFQLRKLRGRAWMIYRYEDLRNVRSINMRENVLCDLVEQWGRDNRVSSDRLIHLTMPESTMRELMRQADTTILLKATVTPGRARPKSKKKPAKKRAAR